MQPAWFRQEDILLVEINNAKVGRGARAHFPNSGWESSLVIDLFRLYILFSQYRSCDDTQEIGSFVLFIKKSTCIHIHAYM